MSSVGDVLAFGRMLLDNGSAILAPETVAEMTRDQLIPAQRNAVWPGSSFLDDQDWGYGMSVLDDARYSWDRGLGTTWSNVPAQDLSVAVLTQRFVHETGPSPVCDDVLNAARVRID